MALGPSSAITPITIPALERTFVALDLETTGLDADREKIIQIGAVKFQGDQVLDRFTTFVNPGRAIPDFIQRLTGIRPDQVSRAPYFPSVSQGLEAFLEDHPIVGHNITFDLRFLETHGLKLFNSHYDTWDLASFILPQTTEYSLVSLARKFGLAHHHAHQAIDDADATRQLFVTLLRQAGELNPGLLAYIQSLAHRSQWAVGDLLDGFDSASNPVAQKDDDNRLFDLSGLNFSRLATRLGRPERRRSDESLGHFTADKITALMNPGGPFSRIFEGFEQRPEQAEMLGAVAQAIYRGEKLIVEGGTGVGKSMAYLLPAALFAASRGLRVVISTNTINLQEQLMRKDIPSLIKVLESSELVEEGLIKATQLKGRTNYLCLRAVELPGAHRKPVGGRDAPAQQDGGVAAGYGRRRPGPRLTCRAGTLSPGSKVSAGEKGGCPALRSGAAACFLRSARERAEQAHIIVVNHALLLSDLARGRRHNSRLPVPDCRRSPQPGRRGNSAVRLSVDAGTIERRYGIARPVEPGGQVGLCFS